jgi:hypothetical protein
MDDMRQEGIKRAIVWMKIDFNRHGKPIRMQVDRTEYFTQYEGGRVLDLNLFNSFRDRGLQQRLAAIALQKAAHGNWVDVPRPKPRPFVGGVVIEFFDDEWLPTLDAPLYCAGRGCLSDASTNQ